MSKTDTKRTLFHKIHKLSQLCADIQKRQEETAHILDDPIAEMQIEIPPQLLKYAYQQPDPEPKKSSVVKNSSPTKTVSSKRPQTSTSKKNTKSVSPTPPTPEYVRRLYER